MKTGSFTALPDLEVELVFVVLKVNIDFKGNLNSPGCSAGQCITPDEFLCRRFIVGHVWCLEV